MSITKLVASVCYYLQLHKIAYFLNRRRKRILTFHNVLTDDVFDDTVANGVSCSFSQFKFIIDEVSKYFDFSLDLNDPKTVTVTFDDGYQNQVNVAAPYLYSKRIPAYLFVSGQLIYMSDINEKKYNPLTIDLLLHWVSYVPNGIYNACLNGINKEIEIFSDNRLKVWSSIIWPAFMEDSKMKGFSLLNALDKAYPINRIIEALPLKYVKQRLSGISVAQIGDLTKYGWQVGWHTYSHYPLSKLSSEEKIKELTPNEYIESKVLSFPYGGPMEVDEECLSIAQKLGYSAAVSNVNVVSRMTGEWFRSRMALNPDPVMLHFELSGLKYLIKYRRLLPLK